MVLFEIRHTEIADRLIDDCLFYVAVNFANSNAVNSLYYDIVETEKILEYTAKSFKLCDDEYLAKNGYRKIKLKKHDYILIYQVVGDIVFIEAMFHTLQDYENLFKNIY